MWIKHYYIWLSVSDILYRCYFIVTSVISSAYLYHRFSLSDQTLITGNLILARCAPGLVTDQYIIICPSNYLIGHSIIPRYVWVFSLYFLTYFMGCNNLYCNICALIIHVSNQLPYFVTYMYMQILLMFISIVFASNHFVAFTFFMLT